MKRAIDVQFESPSKRGKSIGREEHAEIASDNLDGCDCSICWWTDALIRCDKCKADMVEKKKLDEEFDKYRHEFIERLEMSRTEEP